MPPPRSVAELPAWRADPPAAQLFENGSVVYGRTDAGAHARRMKGQACRMFDNRETGKAVILPN